MSKKQKRGVTYGEPKDARGVVQRITSKAFQQRRELEYAGRIAQLMDCWMKSRELNEIADIDRSLTALEETPLEYRNESEFNECS